jgi:stearoyl-CoA desaturase (delta-9 desaturase)
MAGVPEPAGGDRQFGVIELRGRAKRIHRAISIAVVGIPTIGLLVAIVLTAFLQIRPTACDLWLFGSLTVLTLIGLGAGFHRLFSHHAFRAVPALRVFLAVMGSMAAEGPLLLWVANHRRHHHYTDMLGDPHSPHFGMRRPLESWRGWWHGHTGWLFAPRLPLIARYAPDLLKDSLVVAMSRTYLSWLALGLALPATIGTYVAGGHGALSGLLWGGLVRMFVVHHCTWATNSICHKFGTRPFVTKPGDRSTNNWLIAIITLGDGWHHNHHAFPSSAAHGLRWWEIDVNALLILGFARIGLAWDIKRPTAEQIESRRSHPGTD